jgi:hypothetical protein
MEKFLQLFGRTLDKFNFVSFRFSFLVIFFRIFFGLVKHISIYLEVRIVKWIHDRVVFNMTHIILTDFNEKIHTVQIIANFNRLIT